MFIIRNCPAVVQVLHSNVGEVTLSYVLSSQQRRRGHPGKEEAHLRAEGQKRENEPRRRDSGLEDSRERRWRSKCVFLMKKNTFLETYFHAYVGLVSSTRPFSL